jgi:hypothetical protein
MPSDVAHQDVSTGREINVEMRERPRSDLFHFINERDVVFVHRSAVDGQRVGRDIGAKDDELVCRRPIVRDVEGVRTGRCAGGLQRDVEVAEGRADAGSGFRILRGFGAARHKETEHDRAAGSKRTQEATAAAALGWLRVRCGHRT